MAYVLLAGSFSGSLRVLSDLTISGYAGDERSLDRGEPEELYLFNLEGREYWSYSSGDYAIVYGGRTYLPNLIRRSDVQLTANSLKNKLDINVDISNTFARNYLSGVFEGEIKLTIYRRHRCSADYKTYWKGYVQGVGFKDGKPLIVAGLKDRSLGRLGLMRKYQRNCGLTLYSPWCTILDTDPLYHVHGTILTVNGATITATVLGTKADGWFWNGKFETDNNSCLQRIVYHVGTTIKIARPIVSLSVGDTFIANAGCDYLKATCKTKFNNKLNFGGQNIPAKNPFGGSIVYK